MTLLSLWKILGAIALAVCSGLLIPAKFTIFGISLIQLFGLVGQLFLNALTLVVVPLVCSSIIVGASKMGSDRSMGALGIRTFCYFILTSLLAIMVGFTLMTWFEPGIGMSLPENSTAARQMQESGFQKIEQILFRLIPTNIVAAASQAQMLGLIVFSLVFGYFLGKIEPQQSAALLSFWNGLNQVMMKVTQFVMRFLPFGLFALIAKVTAETGWRSLISVGHFFFLVILGLFLYSVVVLPLLLRAMRSMSARKQLDAMLPALITAFSTSSSAASLPVTMECMEKRAGISSRICSFVIPLGVSINMPGTALYAGSAVLFIAQAYHVPIDFSTSLMVIVMVLLTSFGVAGIPSSSLFAIITVISMIGIPPEGIGLIFAVERVLDMCRTTVNIWSNSCCTALIDSSERSLIVSNALVDNPS